MIPRSDRKVLYLRLRWKGLTAGPTAASTKLAERFYIQDAKDVPIRKWFNVEIYLRQSDSFTGKLIVWQDGTKIFDLNGVRTRLPSGDQRYSVNNYSNGLDSPIATLYIDDVTISTTRVSTNLAGAGPAESSRAARPAQSFLAERVSHSTTEHSDSHHSGPLVRAEEARWTELGEGDTGDPAASDNLRDGSISDSAPLIKIGLILSALLAVATTLSRRGRVT
jgi:hypothetical protein